MAMKSGICKISLQFYFYRAANVRKSLVVTQAGDAARFRRIVVVGSETVITQRRED